MRVDFTIAIAFGSNGDRLFDAIALVVELAKALAESGYSVNFVAHYEPSLKGAVSLNGALIRLDGDYREEIVNAVKEQLIWHTLSLMGLRLEGRAS
ncbi:MAG: hypothetical protein ABWK00_01740 [Desulfurococcaceae archaeon]